MHERTQRLVCRIVFLLACIVPTILISGSVLYFNRPWQEQDWQRQIESKLHARVSISRVTASRPGERQIHDIRLADLQTGEPFASIDKLHLQSWNTLHANRLEISSQELCDLARTVQSWLSADECPPVKFKAANLLFSRGENEPYKLANVEVAVEPLTLQKRRLTFQADVLFNASHPATVRLQVERTSAGIWDVSIDCREGQLPVWLFAEFVPGAASWNEANFAGSMHLSSTKNYLNGSLQGTIAPVDLQTWLGKDSPHILRGNALLKFDRLSWQDRQIREAQGSLESEPGQIGHSLTTALTKSLYFVPGKQLTTGSTTEVLYFEKLACNFMISEAGLSVTGNCRTSSSESPACLIAGEGEPLLFQPSYSNLPLTHFVRVFCPLEKYWLPGMRKAADLAETLPMPEGENLRK